MLKFIFTMLSYFGVVDQWLMCRVKDKALDAIIKNDSRPLVYAIQNFGIYKINSYPVRVLWVYTIGYIHQNVPVRGSIKYSWSVGNNAKSCLKNTFIDF